MTERISIPPNDKFNKILVNNTHPADWINPQPQDVYNLIVIGAGAAGLVSSIVAGTLGAKVALVEKSLLGGDCLNSGCVPSKSLLCSAKLARKIKEAARFGLQAEQSANIDFSIVMKRLRQKRAEISYHDSAQRCHDLGVDVFLGEGRFCDNNTLQVGDSKLRFKKAIIATGARALVPEISGLDKVEYFTNETIFNLTELPKRLLVVGGGPIGCELAQGFRRLGSEVVIIQHNRFLPREDKEAADLLESVFSAEGIEVYLNAKPEKISINDNGSKVITIKQNDRFIEIEGTDILFGTGRIPNVTDMGLDTAGVDYSLKHGVKVNDYLQTSNKHIYAAGDCAMNWKFTHAADAAAQIAIQNALFKGKKRVSSLVMPWCTFTDPEIAHVGMYNRDAAEIGLKVDTYFFDLKENDRAVVESEELGFVKVLVKNGSDKIIGATIVSSHAGELIGQFTTAIVAGVGLGKLSSVIQPYPTQAESIKRVAGLYTKSRFTPFLARLIKWWLKF